MAWGGVWGLQAGGAVGEVNGAEVPVDFRASLLTAWHLVGLWTPHAGCLCMPMVMLEVLGSSCGAGEADGFTSTLRCPCGQT